jgi:hypothetical protein
MDQMRGQRQRPRRSGWSFRPWLALFSLLLQLGATIGHIHPEDFAAAPGVDARAAPVAVGEALTQPGRDLPSLPNHDDCPLCASIRMVGASALPAGVALLVATEFGPAPLSAHRELRLAGIPYLLFRTRAPPVA